MKASITAEITLPVSGGTGYANRSSLSLFLKEVGELSLPDDEWNLSEMVQAIQNGLKKLVLGIPSGTLTLDSSLAVSLEGEDFKISGEGEWDGAFAGFAGGMSGYCSFEGSFKSIRKGTYKLTSDRSPWGYNDPWDVEPEKYFERISRHRAGLNYSAAIDDAADAARIQAIAWNDRSTEEQTFLREWDEGIMRREKLGVEEFIAAVNDRTLELGAADSDCALPPEVIQQLREASPSKEALSSSFVFAEEQKFYTSWNPSSTEIRWMICSTFLTKEESLNWWASEKETSILNEWKEGLRRAKRSERQDYENEYEDYEEDADA